MWWTSQQKKLPINKISCQHAHCALKQLDLNHKNFLNARKSNKTQIISIFLIAQRPCWELISLNGYFFCLEVCQFSRDTINILFI